MNGSEHLRQTLEYYRQQRLKKLDELRPLELMIRQLEKELGEAATGAASGDMALSLSDGLPMADSFNGSIRPAEIRADEFFGMSQSDAARAYLNKVRHAVSFDHLVEALKKGGAEVGGTRPAHTLRVSLMRNPLREFVIPSEGHVGLRAFYPGLPKAERAAKPKKGRKQKTAKKAPSAKTAKRGRPRKQIAQAKEQSNAKAITKQPSEVIIALRQVLGQGEPKTREDLVKALEAKLGRKVVPISVSGALRSKEFKESDGKFQLAK